MENKGVAAVILAAGYSSRMGEFKPMMPIEGVPAITKVMTAFRDAGIRKILVVTGHNRELLQREIHAFGACEAYNPNYDTGMFSSIQAGISALDGAEAVLLQPVDCPLLSVETIKKLVKAGEKREGAFIVPCYNGKKGHPLYIPGQFLQKICEYSGQGGLKGAMATHGAELKKLHGFDESVVLDMDTPEGYEDIKDYIKGRQPMRYKGKIILVRHGQTKQHKEPVFIGQTDVPISDQGRKQAVEAAEKLLKIGFHTDRIYCSDLKRTRETAQIIRAELADRDQADSMKIIEIPQLREMNLGEWDGRFISEIKRDFPLEYEARGHDIIGYKTGNAMENFYDLQYRVVKALRKLLEAEYEAAELLGPDQQCRDVVIVTHAGVIRVIMANLLGYTLEETHKMDIPKGSVTLAEIV